MNALILATIVGSLVTDAPFSQDAPRLGPAEREYLLATTPDRQHARGYALKQIENGGSPAVDVPEPAKELTLYWMERMFKPDALPPRDQIRWYGTALQTTLGLWEHVNAVLRIDGRKALWADGFSDEDPNLINPMWLWVELHEGELDTSSEAAAKLGLEPLLRSWLRLYDESAPIRLETECDEHHAEYGYWSFGVSQETPDELPYVCGWMWRMGVLTNGRHLFINVQSCVDSTYPWKGRSEYFLSVGPYRKFSRFTGEPIKYDTALTDRSRHNRGGG